MDQGWGIGDLLWEVVGRECSLQVHVLLVRRVGLRVRMAIRHEGYSGGSSVSEMEERIPAWELMLGERRFGVHGFADDDGYMT